MRVGRGGGASKARCASFDLPRHRRSSKNGASLGKHGDPSKQRLQRQQSVEEPHVAHRNDAAPDHCHRQYHASNQTEQADAANLREQPAHRRAVEVLSEGVYRIVDLIDVLQ